MAKRKAIPKKNTSMSSQSGGTQESQKNPTKKRSMKNAMFVGNKRFTILRSTLRDIKRLQSTVFNCIPRLPFSRLVREILMEFGTTHKVQFEALKALQEAAEIYLTYLMEDSNKCAMHARRVTLMPKDMHLVLDIRGCSDPGFS